MVTLVTFVGRPAANREYRRARYRFEDGIEIESKFFAAAALEWLRRVGRPPQRLIVIGTPTSGWDVLMELVERLAPAVADDVLEWAVAVSASLSPGPVDERLLRDFEQRFSASIGVQVSCRLADNEGDSVFAQLDQVLQSGDRVVLDITHSFRSMPIHALVSLGAMRWLKDIELIDIMYGAFEESNADGSVPARSLGATAQLAHATPALAQLALVDDVGAIAPYLGESLSASDLASHLVATQRLESIMLFDSAANKRGQALGQLRSVLATALSGMRRTVAVKVRDTLDSLNHGTGSLGLRDRAERALERGDYIRAIGLANEALTLKVVELHGLRQLAREEVGRAPRGDLDAYQTLNRLARDRLKVGAQHPSAPRHGHTSARQALRTVNNARNAVMHAGAGVGDQTTPRDLLDPEATRALVAWALRFYDFLA